eukprot:TRINITY_DN1434_c0_g2_i1.p1 TRINITY_DN1434_c0_g2~~TRINITY_DN1434_c0_g2_i1.p1  ORF type:complete len:233 (-),score=45.46 TRINITY_DN1434_c0_g2_i1:266-964(-)
MSNTRQFKIVLLGEGRVGKTSLVLRYVNNVFSDKQVSTIQASFLTKRVAIGDTRATLSIWDTAGQERFHSLGPIYYRDSNGALLVYDITDADTFTQVKKWVKELRKMVGNDITINIVGNKSDLERNRQVDQDEAKAYAESVGAKHFVASARINRGVEEVFMDLTKRMIDKAPAASSRGSSRGSKAGAAARGSVAATGSRGTMGGRRNTLKVVADDGNEQQPRNEGKKKGGCC